MENKNFTGTLGKVTGIERRESVHRTLETLRMKQHEFMAGHTGRPLRDMLLDLDLGLLELENLESLRQELHCQFVASLLDDEDFRSLEIMGHFYDWEGTHAFGLAKAVATPHGHEEEKFTLWVALAIGVNGDITVSLDMFQLCDFDSLEDSKYVGGSIGYMLDNLSDLLPGGDGWQADEGI